MRRAEGDPDEAAGPRPDWTPEEYASLEEHFKQVAYGGWVLPLVGAGGLIILCRGDWVGSAPALLLGYLLALLWLRPLRRRPIGPSVAAIAAMTPREVAQFRWVIRRVRLRPALLAHLAPLLFAGPLALLWLRQGARPTADAATAGVIALFSWGTSFALLACVLYLQGLGILRRHAPPAGRAGPPR